MLQRPVSQPLVMAPNADGLSAVQNVVSCTVAGKHMTPHLMLLQQSVHQVLLSN